jgi:hypothetical protein
MIWMLIAALSMAACQPAGEGIRARNGYARSKVLIDALMQFREANNQYPATLDALAPKFLSNQSLRAPSDPSENFPFEYVRREDGQFELAFRYTGPGLNRCRFQSDSRQWSCRSAF